MGHFAPPSMCAPTFRHTPFARWQTPFCRRDAPCPTLYHRLQCRPTLRHCGNEAHLTISPRDPYPDLPEPCRTAIGMHTTFAHCPLPGREVCKICGKQIDKNHGHVPCSDENTRQICAGVFHLARKARRKRRCDCGKGILKGALGTGVGQPPTGVNGERAAARPISRKSRWLRVNHMRTKSERAFPSSLI